MIHKSTHFKMNIYLMKKFKTEVKKANLVS